MVGRGAATYPCPELGLGSATSPKHLHCSQPQHLPANAGVGGVLSPAALISAGTLLIFSLLRWESEHSWFEAQAWIRTGAKGDRHLQQLLMHNGEPEAKVVGSVLIQEGRSAAHVDCSEHVFPAPKTPDPAGKPCSLLSCGGSAEIQTHPLCVHSTLNLFHSTHLGCP